MINFTVGPRKDQPIIYEILNLNPIVGVHPTEELLETSADFSQQTVALVLRSSQTVGAGEDGELSASRSGLSSWTSIFCSVIDEVVLVIVGRVGGDQAR